MRNVRISSKGNEYSFDVERGTSAPLVEEWAKRNAAQQSESYTMLDPDITNEHRYLSTHFHSHEDQLDFQDKMKKSPRQYWTVYTATVDHNHAKWREMKGCCQAGYEHSLIYWLCVRTESSTRERWEALANELREIGYSEAAIASVPYIGPQPIPPGMDEHWMDAG